MRFLKYHFVDTVKSNHTQGARFDPSMEIFLQCKTFVSEQFNVAARPKLNLLSS